MAATPQTTFSYASMWMKSFFTLIKLSPKSVPHGPTANIPTWAQIMAWRWIGDKPPSEPMLTDSLTHTCGTMGRWVNWINLQAIMILSCLVMYDTLHGFPPQRKVTRSFDIFLDLRLNKRFSKHSRPGVLRRHRAHYDVTVMWRQRVLYYRNSIDYNDKCAKMCFGRWNIAQTVLHMLNTVANKCYVFITVTSQKSQSVSNHQQIAYPTQDVFPSQGPGMRQSDQTSTPILGFKIYLWFIKNRWKDICRI